MRKLFSTLLLTLASFCSLWAQREIEVSTAQELKKAILSNYKARIKLVADIDISELGKICDTFAGTIDGGYTIIDEETGKEKIAPHVLKGKRGQNRGEDHYLFETLDHAWFENVAFERFRVSDDDHDNLGVIARKALGTVFWNFTMAGVSVFCDQDNAGAIVGVAEDCTFDNVKILDCDVTVDGITAGGLVGSSKGCKYTACTTNLHTRVFADGRDGIFFSTNTANSGGLVGYSDGDQFLLCFNSGWVGANQEKVGGIVGYSLSSHYTSCQNFGCVLQCSESAFAEYYATNAKNYSKTDYLFKDIPWITWTLASSAGIGVTVAIVASAGITGPVILAATIVGSAVFAIIMAIDRVFLSDHDELGGLVGHAEHGSFEHCSNYGFYDSIDGECGGIVGLGKYVSINNCLSATTPCDDFGRVSTCGTIIGSAQECTITNCLSVGKIRAIGSESGTKPASGNNYVVSDEKDLKISKYETQVPTSLAKSGILARWLNNGYENKSKHEEPWHQALTDISVDDPADAFPVLSSKRNCVRIEDIKDVTVITNGDELTAFAERVNSGDQYACAVLDGDISLSNRNWTPIGTDSHPFRGMFDGRGHMVYALSVNMEKNEGAGLFGVVADNAEIRNVAISTDSQIRSNKEAGAAGIVGLVHIESRAGNVVITRCGNYANVTAPKHAGGILGRVMTDGSDDIIKVMVDSCFNMGTITATQGMSAHLCGYVKEYGYITNSWTGGRLERPDTSSPLPYDSGNPSKESEYFAGYGTRLTLTDCYAVETGDQTSTLQQQGVTHVSWDEFNRLHWTYIQPGFGQGTGISTFSVTTLSTVGWYDLYGNPVDENYQGVRVGNGKKVIVR